MNRDNDDIIEIEDYRVDDVEIVPVDDEPEHAAPPPPPHIWTREVRSTGPGCCFGLSVTIMVLIGVFLLGLLAMCWLVVQLFELL